MTESLLVVLYGEVVGTIERAHRRADMTFRYDEQYASRSTVPVSIRMPVGTTAYKQRDVSAVIDGLLPENTATRERWASRLGTDSDDSFGLLARMGWDCPGAIQFCPPEQLHDMQTRPDEMTPMSEVEIGDRLRALRDDSASWSLPEEHWSLPGQQEKFTLTWAEGRWNLAKAATPTTHIIKPGIGRLHNQALVEHATMHAAHALGVDMAHTEFTYFDGEPAVVVTRFDRRPYQGGVVRLHQEDFCQATGRLPAKKYEADQGPTLADMVIVVNKHVTDRPVGRLALADYLIVNYVTGSPDGHSKNISLSLLPGRIQVAPLYDLATGIPYEGRPEYRRVALAIGGRRDFGQVLAKHWDKAADTLGLPQDQVRGRARDLARDFPDAFAQALAEMDTPQAREVHERSTKRIAQHCSDVISRLDAPTRAPRRQADAT